MIELPDSPTDPIQLADWMELQAIVSPDGNTSQGDLAGALRVASVLEPDDGEVIEQKTLEVFDELEQRARAAEGGYPFCVRPPGVLQLLSTWTDFPVYTFCLCLSYFEWITYQKGKTNSSKLFEDVSGMAAKRYLGGSVVGFGAPRVQLPPSFPAAIEKLCQLIGEGDGYREQGVHPQDDKLDLVAWKDSPDKLPGKLMLFGQCAAGRHWLDKLTEMQPKEFAQLWILNGTYSQIVSSFFIPHRVVRARWVYAITYGGILFDRCRIAFWAHGAELNYNPYIEWVEHRLSQITA